jgi:KDO2-lipid IV(A) lauroyltransferase
LSIREKYGGTIIAPKNGVKEGLRALRKGIFLGIVGDQGMPDSGYSFPFLGRRAWTTTAPALLSYKTSCPIIFAATKRTPYGYAIRYGDPIWPNLSQPIDTEVVRIMNQVLTQLQESILASPSEWLWQHNRWKQQTPKILYKRFRRDCVYLVMPTEKAAFYAVFPHLSTLRSIYHNAFVFIAAPAWSQGEKWIESDAIFFYEKVEETLRKDYRYKLVFDFLGYPPLAKFYERLSAFEVLTLDGLRAIAKEPVNDLSDLFLQALCRKR